MLHWRLNQTKILCVLYYYSVPCNYLLIIYFSCCKMDTNEPFTKVRLLLSSIHFWTASMHVFVQVAFAICEVGIWRSVAKAIQQVVECYKNISIRHEWCQPGGTVQICQCHLIALLFLSARCTLCLKKQDTKLLPITSPNVNRFSKFFHWQTHW